RSAANDATSGFSVFRSQVVLILPGPQRLIELDFLASIPFATSLRIFFGRLAFFLLRYLRGGLPCFQSRIPDQRNSQIRFESVPICTDRGHRLCLPWRPW